MPRTNGTVVWPWNWSWNESPSVSKPVRFTRWFSFPEVSHARLRSANGTLCEPSDERKRYFPTIVMSPCEPPHGVSDIRIGSAGFVTSKIRKPA